ncbi:MAG: aminotransferase class IV [Pseudomonadota bacterium]
MRAVGFVDGVITPLEEARVPVLDRGFLYGDSIYEVFRTYDGIPFMFDEHYARLQNSAALSGMTVSFSLSTIADAAKSCIAVSENTNRDDVYIRYQITRGEGPVDLYPDASLQQRLIIIAKPVPSWNPDHYSQGMTMALTHLRRNATDSLNPNIKGGNYLNNVLALAEARQYGADECLMLDHHNNVTECSNSNVWFVIDGVLTTPEAGNLVGLTRKKLIGLFSQTGNPVSIRDVEAQELLSAEECFVTSATREVMPVKSLRFLDGSERGFPAGGGRITRQAIKLYSDMLVQFREENRNDRWF